MSDVSQMASEVSGLLTVGYDAPAFLSKLAATLRAMHPGVTLAFVDGDNESVKQGLVDGKFDAIYFVEDVPDPRIEAATLIFAPTYCLCRKDHPIALSSAARP
ncbi:LysR substrate-binding domain-containing protein [Sulfitobacter sp. D35]|uniref:LysR substrate-binding domain-containing protein n=1 Tax=Sulfitobacter sp. D35 TaxID=3083252 RepID=UPI00296F0747|nr:LysR substrate-binding domain-containing protein [Sulfitobacter sp. D35]MDW4499432.1 LysR substrate-binding domain-containing protein [Sulfitobacter sp. D35]